MSSTITVSYSEIDTARQCLMKHELAYKLRWQSPTTSPALARGTLWHALLERHYLVLQKWQNVEVGWDEEQIRAELQANVMALLYDEGMRQTEEQELIEWMYTGYLELYGLDLPWKILAVEHAAEVYLPTPAGGRSRFKLKMKIDLIVKDEQGHLLCVDHKSGKDLPKQRVLDIDDQFGLYTWGLRQLGKKIFGAIHSAARTQRNVSKPQPLDERFSRTQLYRTDKELDIIAVEAYRAARAAWLIPIGEAPRSPNTDTCGWKCSYTEACLMGRKGLDMTEILQGSGYVQSFERH